MAEKGRSQPSCYLALHLQRTNHFSEVSPFTQGRCKIRQPPADGWWELIWSEWKRVTIGPRGRFLVGDTLCTTECANGTRAWCCHHLDGTVTLVMNKPEKGCGPKIIFSNNPNVRTPRT